MKMVEETYIMRKNQTASGEVSFRVRTATNPYGFSSTVKSRSTVIFMPTH